jgi:phosphatidylglycerol:prolipoprotein diacylglycerol transferase
VNPIGFGFNVLSLLVGGFVYWYFAERGRSHYLRLAAAIGLIAGALTARFAEFFAEGAPASYLIHPEFGGRTILGGVIGGWIGVELAKRWLRVRTPTGDAFGLALAAGEVFGRIGCLFNGCCFGEPTSVPWAVYQHGALRHPTQIYSGFVAALTFGVLLWAKPRVAEGQVFALYLMLFAAGRLVIEPFRADFGSGTGAYAAETASALLLIAGAVVWRRRTVPARIVAVS